MPSKMSSIDGVKRGRDIFMIHPDLIEEVQGFNPRQAIDPVKLEELKSYIRVNGVLELPPIHVRLIGDRIELVKGHRRTRAVRELIAEGESIKGLPAQQITQTDPAKLLLSALAENNGVPLTSFEEGTAFERLMNFGWTVQDIVANGGYSSTHVYNCLKLLTAEEPVKEALAEKIITTTDAVSIIKRSNRTGEQQADVLDHVTSTKVDKRTKAAKEVPIDILCGRALAPIVERYGLKRVSDIIDQWPPEEL